MDRRIILLSGPVASGKSMLAGRLSDRFKMKLLRTSDLLRATMAGSNESGRIALQDWGDELDRRTQGTWVLDSLRQMLQGEEPSTNVVVDSVKIQEQIDAIRDAYGSSVTHIHMTAPLDVLASRYGSRESSPSQVEHLSYQDVRLNQTESLVGRLSEIADVVIDSNRCTEEDVLVRVASHLRLYGEESAGWVDVIVGRPIWERRERTNSSLSRQRLRPACPCRGSQCWTQGIRTPGSVYSSPTSVGHQKDCPASPVDWSWRRVECQHTVERNCGMQCRRYPPKDRPRSDGYHR